MTKTSVRVPKVSVSEQCGCNMHKLCKWSGCMCDCHKVEGLRNDMPRIRIDNPGILQNKIHWREKKI